MSSIIEITPVYQNIMVYNRYFKKYEYIYKYNIKHNINNKISLFDVENDIDNFYHDIVFPVISEYDDNDRVLIKIESDNLTSDIFMCYKKSKYDKHEFLNAISLISQSNKTFLLDGSFTFKISIIKNSTGRGLKAPKESHYSSGIVKIYNNDNKCGYYAIFLALFDINNDNKLEWKKMIRKDIKQNNLQNFVFKQCEKYGIDISKPIDRNNITDIQNKLKDYQIVIIDHFRKSCWFKGDDKMKKIFIEYNDEHFNYIRYIKRYFNSDFCVKCWMKIKKNHVCKSGCKYCYSSNKCDYSLESYQCSDCNRNFLGVICFNNHKINNKCVDFKNKCFKCGVEYFKNSKHKCHEIFCVLCNNYYKSPHYCYIKPINIKTLMKQDDAYKIYVAYDIESMIVNNNGYTIHKPNLLIANVVCDKCNVNKNKCDYCGPFYNEYFSINCVKLFIDYVIIKLANIAEQNGGRVYCFAHNAKGYDNHFIIQELHKRKFTDIKMLMNGTKVLKIDLGNVRFFDTLSLFLSPLDKLPKIFGLKTCVKGFFPHLFNTIENQEYVGPIPDKKYYS